MSHRKQVQARDKLVHKLTRDGLMEVNTATGEATSISKREKDFQIQKDKAPRQEAFVRKLHRMEDVRPHSVTVKRKEPAHNVKLPYDMVRQKDFGQPETTPQQDRYPNIHEPPADTLFFQEQLNFEPNQNVVNEKENVQKGGVYHQRFTESILLVENHQTFQTEVNNVRNVIISTKRASVPHKEVYQGQSSDKLQKPGKFPFADEENTASGKKLKRARQRVEKTDARLEQARNRLPRKKIRTEKSSGGTRNRQQSKMTFEDGVKSPQSLGKGDLLMRPVKAGTSFSVGYMHSRLFQMEEENVETKAAHKGELLAEGGLRTAYRIHKTAPYRHVKRLEQLSAKQNARRAYQKMLHENPQFRTNPMSRFIQKQKIKRNYVKAARESMQTAQRLKQAGAVGGKLLKLASGFVTKHPAVIGTIALLLLVMITFSALFTSCANLAMGGLSSVLLTSYTAEDADINDAELTYSEWETNLQVQIQNAENAHPGYDEYRYNIDDISHNPFELLAYLSAKYKDFTIGGVRTELQRIFNEQYKLEFVQETENRYRTETYTDPVTGETTDVEVPYHWYILNINLTSKSFTDIVGPGLTIDEEEMYSLYMQTKGNRQYIASPLDFDWIPYVTSYYGWRIHPVTGEKDYHKGIDIGVPIGTDILSGLDGTVIQAAYDEGEYGYYIVIEGKDGLVSKYAHCDRLIASVGQQVRKGDVIAKSGNTGRSTEPHLHLEVLKDGQYLNPLYFAESPGSGTNGSNEPIIPDYPGEPMGDSRFAALMLEAQKHLGKPYVFGASGPDTFDCSGFICYSINHSEIAAIGRTTAQGLYNLCTPVSSANAKPGDLIFFTGTYSTPNTCSHVGIYIGNGRMIHAGNPVQYASINTSYWQEHFYAFGRLP